MVLYTEDQLRRAWVGHLIELYQLEDENGFLFAEYPDLEEFREIFEEELEANPDLI